MESGGCFSLSGASLRQTEILCTERFDGSSVINVQAAAGFGIDIFVSVFSLAVRLAFPFVATEFVLEMGMGILMKLIPQIHVFVINMQFKILLAITMLFVLAAPITTFIENYIIVMFDNLEEALNVLVS